MPENNAYTAMALTRANVAPDASSIEIQLAVVGEAPLVLTMSPNSLGQIVSGLTEVDSAVQIQIGSTTGHHAVFADDAQDVTAKEAAGGDKVVLSVRNSRGRFQSFALSLEQTQQLRIDMKKAEAKARELASKSRN
jgi:Ethanolamine utilization protein EutJ (predicted chaperonin)